MCMRVGMPTVLVVHVRLGRAVLELGICKHLFEPSFKELYEAFVADPAA